MTDAGRAILVVEDENIIALDISQALVDLGYRVAGVAATGEDAIRLAEEMRPDLVLMDIHLRGEMDGIDAAMRIREVIHRPVIYLTAYSNDETLARAKLSGPFGYLVKPFDDRELRVQIEMALYRHGVEERLNASEARYRAVFANAHEAILIIDDAGGISDANPAAGRLLGRGREGLIGRPLSNLLSCADAQADPLAVASETGLAVAARVRRDHREDIPVEMSVSAWQDEGVRFRTIMLRDVSERDRLRREQEQSAEAERQRVLLQRFIADAPVAIAMFDRDMRCLTASERWRKDLRLLGEPLAGRALAAVFPIGEAGCRSLHQRCVAGEEPGGESEMTHADGHRDWCSWQARPWRSSQGGIGGLILYCELITQRRRAEQALQHKQAELIRSNAELEQFAYVSSHDLQEPLRMVSLYLDLIRRDIGERGDAKLEAHIRKAVDGAERMRELIGALLTFSRIDQAPPAVELADANQALDDALGNLKLAIDMANAQVVWEELPAVRIDRALLTQVFQNLVSNAIKFRRDEPPVVRISARRHEDCWEFSVQDNGIGIDSRHHDKIFDIFQRLHEREAYAGIGIGLSTVKKIVQRNHGSLRVSSEPGSGSTFSFSIPIDAAGSGNS